MRRFRHLRRLTAVVAQLLLLQLAFASSASACPLDNGQSPAEAHMTAGSVPHSQHQQDDVGAAAEHASAPASHHHAGSHCDVACAPATCGAAGHCSVSATLDDAASELPSATAHQLASIGRDVAPHSVNTAPEPPPPRV